MNIPFLWMDYPAAMMFYVMPLFIIIHYITFFVFDYSFCEIIKIVIINKNIESIG